MLNRTQFFQRDNERIWTKVIEIPLLGDSVTIKRLTGAAIAHSAARKDDTETMGACYDIVASVVDESGAYVFTPDDIPLINEMGADVILFLSREIKLFNNLEGDTEKN